MRDSRRVVDQAGHAVRLRLHDLEEPLARGGVVARRPLQGFDEAGQRGERSAQLVAGIGDEVGAHLLDPPQRRDRRNVISTKPAEGSTAAIGVTTASYQRSTGTASKNSTRCAAPLARARRMASSTSGTRSPSETGSPRRSAGAIAVARIERDHVAVAVERHHRIGQPGQHRLDQRLADPRHRQRGGQAGARVLAVAGRDHGRDRHDGGKRHQRRQRTEHAGEPKTGEHDRGRRQHQPRASEPVEPVVPARGSAAIATCRHLCRACDPGSPAISPCWCAHHS